MSRTGRMRVSLEAHCGAHSTQKCRRYKRYHRRANEHVLRITVGELEILMRGLELARKVVIMIRAVMHRLLQNLP